MLLLLSLAPPRLLLLPVLPAAAVLLCRGESGGLALGQADGSAPAGV